ncbi:MAG: hypothetical protein IJG36_08205 [Synergistaceae bacterium]|nr:hypothetical protein [Synergistaceae bacterium]MBQ4401181.1 hypothetical protein [Synergistaceae bacterium]MBQ4430700.1 hypothetical protein [Synergistaceae bacterium]MBQ6666144.1 hypothetical protein [Synergistaceae bacterium]MBQ6971034.1 hypothetical protein [Synergistaceae bacterium]
MNKAHVLGLPESTTPEALETRFNYAKTLTFGDRVLMAGYRYNGLHECGYYGAVYEFTSRKHTCEDEIRLVEVSGEFFPDDGHAIKWAMTV